MFVRMEKFYFFNKAFKRFKNLEQKLLKNNYKFNKIA